MQFKHPEILWALFLLVIPIIIHLFQLRRFQKTPFTNVAMLQKVVAESRKSNSLKKWLLLFTRLLLLAALVMAFAQPFTSKETAFKPKETVIYLDNSFSMQARNNGISQLERAVQDVIKSMDAKTVFSLFTNEDSFANVTIADIENNLLSMPFTYKQLSLDEINLKASTLFTKSPESIKNLIILSDFQENMAPFTAGIDSTITSLAVPMRTRESKNISIDSVALQDPSADPALLQVFLSGGSPDENVPISVYNGPNLIAKSAAQFDETSRTSVVFSIPANQEINGKLTIADNALGFDNTFYFNIDSREKLKVLAIGNTGSDYLNRLFTNDEFELQKVELNQLDYSALEKQHVVVLDNLVQIPASLQQALRSFTANGGSLIIIPSPEADLNTYNSLLTAFSNTRLSEKVNTTSKVTTITYDHPIYRNVFERRVTNFEYPTVNQYFKISTGLPTILGLEGGDAFLVGLNGLYLFTTSLENGSTNFKSSPVIVPTFYNMAQSSFKMPELYHELGRQSNVTVAVQLGNDNTLKVAKEGYEFIPMQQVYPNQVNLTFDQIPNEDGIYSIENNGQTLKNISFNYPRDESQLSYLDLATFKNLTIEESIPSLFEDLEADNNIAAYWKWFVILALLLALIEVIIQKFVS